ncbi:Uncharacterized protein SCG7109_AH_00170 [Chlamydiales bacterium SCGC AG-110-M15]|nr:Uncharacterized protein SCG7109_AH_00170 [Chlamydiales bacterium SCGC AG-110-M15]
MQIIVLEKTSKDGKELTTALLQDSFKEGNKTETRTLAKLMECSEEELNAIEFAFKHKEKLSQVDMSTLQPLKPEEQIKPEQLKQGLPIGAVWTVLEIAKRLGITDALGEKEPGQIALLQIVAAVLHPNLSLLSPIASPTLQTCGILDLPSEFDEIDFKNNLLWLTYNQEDIEDAIYKNLERPKEEALYLYDITSSYFSQKNDPLEIFYESHESSPMIGLFCDKDGLPLSVNILEDYTDSSFSMRLKAISMRFRSESVTFVGDLEIPGRPKKAKPPLYKITAVKTEKAKQLVKEHIVEKKISDCGIIEGENDQRFIIKRELNRFRVLAIHRLQQQKQIESLIEKNNMAIELGQEQKPDRLAKKINQIITKIKASTWMNSSEEGEKLKLKIDQRKLQELLYLDGCIVLETNIPENKIDTDHILDRYHDITNVNDAFSNRTLTLPNPAAVEEHTFQLVQGHNVILMFAYSIQRHLAEIWKPLNISPDDALKQLANVCAIECGGQVFVPIPNKETQKLLEAANLTLPSRLL